MLRHGRDSSLSSITGSFHDGGSVTSSGSSPILSPYMSPGDSPRESFNTQFSNSMSLQPPGSSKNNNSNNAGNNTFVHKLYNMVVDVQYQHLIAWSYTGSSFIVCNIMEFSRDVLPKHFKHNNFSSFVRQLNMYGFHKVNKSPRGHRTLAENQIWEFSHQKFIKDRPDLLDEIKRKSLETETTKRDNGDINSHMAMMQVSQSEMVQQLARLQDNFTMVVRELEETKSKQFHQQRILENMMKFLTSKGNGVQPPQAAPVQQLQHDMNNTFVENINERPPSIFITSHDIPNQNYFMQRQQQQQFTRPSLTVQTHNLPFSDTLSPGMSPMIDGSPALSAYHTALNTPISSTNPSPFISDDDIPSLYSPHSPLTPNTTFTLNDATFRNNTQQHYYQQPHQDVIMDGGPHYNNTLHTNNDNNTMSLSHQRTA